MNQPNSFCDPKNLDQNYYDCIAVNGFWQIMFAFYHILKPKTLHNATMRAIDRNLIRGIIGLDFIIKYI